jgi:hypothetical protein
MSSQDVDSAIKAVLSDRGLNAVGTFSALFDDFDTEVLMEANTLSNGVLFGTIAQHLENAAERRRIKRPSTPTGIRMGDFLPAYAEVTSPPILSTFTNAVQDLIRQCCPYC